MERERERGLGPETRAIIEAIREMKQSAHETTNYRIITIDLAAARVNELFELEGWFYHLAVGRITGEATIRLNEVTKDAIDLKYVKTVTTPIRRFFITNLAQGGCVVILGVGMDTTFSEPIEQAALPIFRYVAYSEDGAVNTFETSQIKTDTPTLMLATFRRPLDLKSGKILRFHYRLNPTNAVTYTLRIYDSNIAADYESNLHQIYESPAARADDTEYDVLTLPIPFTLGVVGLMYYAIQWSAAPGVTAGFIEVSGEKVS